MVGVYFDNAYLVTRSYMDDGIFFLIFLIAFIIFIVKERIGKYILSTWLCFWFMTQFLSHWFYTFTGNAARKINYFADAIKLIEIEGVYIPDVYHIILHLLIIIAIATTLVYIKKNKPTK